MAVSKDEITRTCQSIVELRKLGRYRQAHSSILALRKELRHVPAVAIEITSLYLVQGHYIRAWDSCQIPESAIFTDGDPTQAFTRHIFDVDCVALALIRAYAGISRFSETTTAMQVARRVYDVWMADKFLEFLPISNGLIAAEEEKTHRETISHLCTALHLGHEDESNVANNDVKVPQSRILLEMYYHRIQVTAAEQTFLEESEVKRTAASRMKVLADWLIAQSRLHEARYIVYFCTGLLNNVAHDQALLETLLENIKGKVNLAYEEANTRLDIAKCIMQINDGKVTKEAQAHIQASQDLFKALNHEFGLLDLMDMQINGIRKSLTPDDLLSWKLDAAEQYFVKECHQQGIKCLLFSIPVTTDMGKIREMTQKLIEQVQKEISIVGGAALEQLLFVQTVSQTVTRAPEYGYARQCIEDYICRLPSGISPTMEGNLYHTMMLAYVNLGNLQKAQEWAERAFLVFRRGESYINISDAANYIGYVQYLQGLEHSSGSVVSLIHHSNALNILQGWADIDRLAGNHNGEISKSLLLARLYSRMELWIQCDRWLSRAKERADRNDIPLDNGEDLLLSQAIRQEKLDEAVELSLQFVERSKALPSSPKFVLGQEYLRAATTFHCRFLHRNNTEGKKPGADFKSICNDLFEAAKLASKALDCYKSSGGTEMVVSAVNYLYSLVKDWSVTTSGDGLLEAWLTEAHFAEDLCDSIRRSSLSIDRIDSLFEKRGVVSNTQLQQLYANAINACLILGKDSEGWLWLQRGKARALSDVFGIRATIPERLLVQIRADADAQALYDRERESSAEIAKALPQDYVSSRQKAETVRGEMRKHPLLAQLLNIREGSWNVQFEESELRLALQMTGRDAKSIKYINWFVPTAAANDPAIVLFVRALDGNTISKKLSITTGSIESWIKRVLEYPPEAEPPLKRNDGNSRLRELNPLIQDLEDLTDEEDILVICPSGPLTRLPLHAIRFRPSNQAVIQRHPVLYSSSAAMFRHCQMRAAAEGTKETLPPENPTMLAVYNEDTDEGRFETQAIYEHAANLRDKFGFKVLEGSAVTKSNFEDSCSQSRSVLYHGHAHFDKLDVLQSGLVLSPDPTSDFTLPSTNSPVIHSTPSSSTIPILPPTSHYLTVSDAFDLDFSRTSPRITLIACDSSTQHVAVGDEPLGFIPALLFAGATSVLGTLWPVESATAREFTEEFYRQCEDQTEKQRTTGQGKVVLDLAAALRETVCKLLAKGRPADWAGYVLYGAWFHVVGEQDSVNCKSGA
ncbi:CHAT domain-containing protein [Paraphoma chrysanthemicola]|uniref:CHAT domain-containing protein n=1 Tax=Paraphoma chrysanthemicola TaxID=798071 RepID=A0A8K0RI55_9PLEO|nr:CHAT domain-containing protein [Paraphoma chrysanthemicola]